MRILLDFGDGSGPVDYTAALAAPPPGHSDFPPSVEAFRIERQRGQHARCHAAMLAAPAGLQTPQQGCRVAVFADNGFEVFRGVIVEPPRRVTALRDQAAPVLLEAVEDAFLANTMPDTGLQPAGAVTHAVRFCDNAIVLDPATAADAAGYAEDVLVTGAEGPVTYVTELFQGDGTTAVFPLTAAPFGAAGGLATMLQDSFTGTRFRTDVWRFVDTGQHIALGSGGLRVTGGNGFDGQTYMAAQQPVELGGTLCAEMRGVVLQTGSDGVLLGMYGNAITIPACFAGVRVNAAAGAQSMVALVNGVESGAAYAWRPGHSYTLRLRLHCAETQRVLESYQALVNGAVQTWGGGLVSAAMQILVEVLDEGLASSTPATVLYAGAVSNSPAQAVFAPVNSVSLVMGAASLLLQQQGSLWVTTTEPDGTVTPRRPGALDTGEDYRTSGAMLQFFPGREPAAGSLLVVRYRLRQRAEARLQSADALARAAELGLPGLRQTSCRVTAPQPRSDADCAAAAQALLAFSGSPAHGVRGVCQLPNAIATADVQPGDAVALPLAGAPVQVPVERVTIRSAHSVPEVLEYQIRFAQETANGLSFRSEPGAAADAWAGSPVYVAGTTAALPGLTVTTVGGMSLQVDAGVAPPVGGGFEVRRHDAGWGPDEAGVSPDGELVLRSPVRSFSVPRAAFAERFYVRMYDGAAVPVYSAQSSLVSTHLPVD